MGGDEQNLRTCAPPHASLSGFRRSCTLRQAHFLLHAFQDGMISCAPLDRGSPLAPHCAPCRCDRTHAHLVHVLVHADAHICSYLQVAVICRSDMQVGHSDRRDLVQRPQLCDVLLLCTTRRADGRVHRALRRARSAQPRQRRHMRRTTRSRAARTARAIADVRNRRPPAAGRSTAVAVGCCALSTPPAARHLFNGSPSRCSRCHASGCLRPRAPI